MATGLVISERPFGLAPRGRDFPRRNRVISGLSRGIIVVEAARRSGSLITARFANEQGREVFAVPGSPFDPRAEGPNDLIREGATLVANARDVIAALSPREGLPPRLPGVFSEPDPDDEALFDEWEYGADVADSDDEPAFTHAPQAPEEQRAVLLGALSASPIEVDALTRLLGVGLAEVQGLLFELELEGLLQRHPGNRVSRA